MAAEKTTVEMVRHHYNEAVACLNAIGEQADVDVARIAAPRLIQSAIAHALLGQLCWQSQLGGSSCCSALPPGSTCSCAR